MSNLTFNPELLRIVRQFRGFGQTALAKMASLSQGTLSKIEAGLLEPNEEMVSNLAKVLNFPVSIFYETYKPFGLPLSVHPMYRKNSSIGKRAIEQLEAELNIRLFNSMKLVKAIEFEEDLPLPFLSLDIYETPEKVAELLRRTWLIPNGPLKNLTDYVERAGCLVFHCDFSQEGVSGVTIKVPGLNPCIFIDKNMPSDRQRFTLAHELGHAIMHKLPSENMEDEANRFASALLMPSKDIRPYLTGKITLEKLATLKLVWKVSMNALLKTAEREGLLTPSQKKYLWIQMTKNGYRTKEPVELDFPKEKAVTIDQIFEYYREDLGYSIDELSILLQTPKEDIDSLYSLNIVKKKPNIRILE